MPRLTTFLLLLFLIIDFPFSAGAICVIQNSDRTAARPAGDAFHRLLAKSELCPERAQALKVLLREAGARVEVAMVANRGFHNPELGSFSFFETVSGHLAPIDMAVARGDFFFGHFTSLTNTREIMLDQEPESGKLMVELIAWDPAKGVFNFYELIGQGGNAQWFYRGDSLDILRDNKFIHRDVTPGQKKFGQTLRCSACHSSGGPIMKELASPHNDWWTIQRPLVFGSNFLSREVKTWVSEVADAADFAENVKSGIRKLEVSSSYQKAKASASLQERLRPLFCENEINLESSPAPNGKGAPVAIPSAFYLNPLLNRASITLASDAYLGLLEDHDMRFPETDRADADHPWLTPVKGVSDLLAIGSLIAESVIDEDFAMAVLSVDMANPVFSAARCSLLKFVPELGPRWREGFVQNLKASSNSVAHELATLLVKKTKARAVRERAQDFADRLKSEGREREDFQKLIRMRKAVFESEISKNPRGQILEPGFRVIFPESGRSVP